MTVEALVERHDRADAVAFHGGNVDGLARGASRNRSDDLPGPAHVRHRDVEHLVDHGLQGLEGRADGIESSDRRVPVQDLLVDLRVRHEALSSRDRSFHLTLRLDLALVIGSDEVHRNVGIDEGRFCSRQTQPRSISASISATSPAGKEWRAAARAAASFRSASPNGA